MKKLRILVADDHELVRRGALGVLHSRRGRRVVGEAANGREAVEKTVRLKPDVAIMDIRMPELDGVEVVRQIREAVPGTMHESDQMVQRALGAGAHGYMLKSDLTDCLPKAVKTVSEGKRFLTPKVSESCWRDFSRPRPNISKRSAQVPEQLLAKPKSSPC